MSDFSECTSLRMLISTDSMEEASALASSVGILAKRMLGKPQCRVTHMYLIILLKLSERLSHCLLGMQCMKSTLRAVLGKKL